MEMKKNMKYLILPILQGAGVCVAFFYHTAQFPEETAIPLYKAAFLILVTVLFGLLLRLFWILLSSYIINIHHFTTL